MKTRILLVVVALSSFGCIAANAQRNERRRPLTFREQLLMKLDSIDLIYFNRLRPNDRFEARRRLDGVVQFVDRREMEMQEKERMLLERERALQERERILLERERDRNNHRDHDRDRDNVVKVSPMKPDEFNKLINAIERTPFDQDKKKIVRTSFVNNFFLVDQVIRIASKFSFDNDRLDVIKSLYPHTLDIDNNYLLFNCFTFSDSKAKLERFIEENTTPVPAPNHPNR